VLAVGRFRLKAAVAAEVNQAASNTSRIICKRDESPGDASDESGKMKLLTLF
jgi:hypothetical protein